MDDKTVQHFQLNIKPVFEFEIHYDDVYNTWGTSRWVHTHIIRSAQKYSNREYVGDGEITLNKIVKGFLCLWNTFPFDFDVIFKNTNKGRFISFGISDEILDDYEKGNTNVLKFAIKLVDASEDYI